MDIYRLFLSRGGYCDPFDVGQGLSRAELKPWITVVTLGASPALESRVKVILPVAGFMNGGSKSLSAKCDLAVGKRLELVSCDSSAKHRTETCSNPDRVLTKGKEA